MDSFVRARYKVNRTPAFQMLSEAQCREIYTAAVEILERTGAKVYDQESKEILEKAGCWIDGEDPFSGRLTEWAVRTAPSRIIQSRRQTPHGSGGW